MNEQNNIKAYTRLAVSDSRKFTYIMIALQFCFRICHQENPRKSCQLGIEWETSTIGLWG